VFEELKKEELTTEYLAFFCSETPFIFLWTIVCQTQSLPVGGTVTTPKCVEKCKRNY